MERHGIGADFACLGRRIAAVGKLYRRIAAQQIDDVAIACGLALDVLFIQMLHIAAHFGFNHDGVEFGGVVADIVGKTQNRHEAQARQGDCQGGFLMAHGENKCQLSIVKVANDNR